MGVHCDEGPAVSRRNLRIAWTHGLQDKISVGELEYTDGTPKLINTQLVLTREDFPVTLRPFRWIETQNFVPPNDEQLTVTGYEINNTANSEAFLFDIKTKALTNLSQSPIRMRRLRGSSQMESTRLLKGLNTGVTIGP